MDRILRSAGGTLTLVNYDESTGSPADAGGGNGTADVTDSAGTTVSSALVATRTAVGTYQVTIPSTYATLDRFDVRWNMPDTSKRFTEFEVVGAFLFTVAGLKAFDPDLASITAATAIAARNIVEDTFHDPQITLGAFRLQGRRETHDGDGSNTLLLERMGPTAVVACTIDGTALTSGELAELVLDGTGELRRGESGIWDEGAGNIGLLYEYGDQTVDAEVARAAKILARYVIKQTAFDASDRATAVFTELGGYRLTLAGRDGPTGLPAVDAVLMRKGLRVPAVA